MNIPYLDLKPQLNALRDDLYKKIHDVVESSQFVMGPAVSDCENALAKFVGSPYCLSAGSGTDALWLALKASNIGPGDEVITTGFSFFATAETIALVGAKPVFVDIEPDTFNIATYKIEAAITANTKAIMPVSLYGQVPDMAEISVLAEKNNLVIIEDAAQSFGASYQGKKSCNLSRFACTSFFPAKPLGCYGDGGAVFCQSAEDFERLQRLRNHGQEGRYYHTEIGLNGRMDTLQCQVILSKLPRYDWEVEQRQRIAEEYSSAWSSLNGLQTPVVRDGRNSVWAQYTLAVDQRDRWIEALKSKGVPTSVHYPRGLHEQPALKHMCPNVKLENVETQSKRVFSVPLYADMPQPHVNHVIQSMKLVHEEMT